IASGRIQIVVLPCCPQGQRCAPTRIEVCRRHRAHGLGQCERGPPTFEAASPEAWQLVVSNTETKSLGQRKDGESCRRMTVRFGGMTLATKGSGKIEPFLRSAFGVRTEEQNLDKLCL